MRGRGGVRARASQPVAMAVGVSRPVAVHGRVAALKVTVRVSIGAESEVRLAVGKAVCERVRGSARR
ncbi:hypothetical protein E2C01_068423 [Portunus trituberculatus]|uniref:Uncharacterized protein n=1 Tax=Portunus trituberculatus TaxID=210409 RepID=A0A5B7HZE2_PORTR|nr:hypothetical protein [Portunus trituberculatus]